MKIINVEEGSMVVEVLGFEVQDNEYFVKLKTHERYRVGAQRSENVYFKITLEDFSKSMRKNWKKLI